MDPMLWEELYILFDDWQRGAKQNLLMQQLPVYGKLTGVTLCLSVGSLNIKFVTSALGIENGGQEKILQAKREEI